MRVSDLATTVIRDLLARGAFAIRFGPFWVRLHSANAGLHEHISKMYADYPCETDPSYADFHIQLLRAAGLRRWVRPQIRFTMDGDSPFVPFPLHQTTAVLEWGLNWVFANHFHEFLILHAAVVERGGHTILLPAPPGSGKSTLCAALVTRGWRLFSDELALISRREGTVVPLPRPISLKNQSIELLKRYSPQAVFNRPILETNKGILAHMKAPTASVLRSTETARAGWVVFPQYQSNERAALEAQSKGTSFLRIAQNAFNYGVLGSEGFELLGDIVDQVECYNLSYGDLDAAVATLDAMA